MQLLVIFHNLISGVLLLSCSNYMINGGWLKEKDQLLNGVDKIRHIPATIIHGKWDTISPLKTAWEFHKVRFKNMKEAFNSVY